MALHSTRESARPKCQCGRKFGRNSELNRHTSQSHSKIKHSCPVLNCTFKVGRKGKINEHLTKAHGFLGLGGRKVKRYTQQIAESSSRYPGQEYQPMIQNQDATRSSLASESTPQNYTTNTSAAMISTNAVLGSGEWVLGCEIERVRTLPQHLHLPQIREETCPTSAPALGESSVTDDLLSATEMMSLGSECGSESITSWMKSSFAGWGIEDWTP